MRSCSSLHPGPGFAPVPRNAAARGRLHPSVCTGVTWEEGCWSSAGSGNRAGGSPSVPPRSSGGSKSACRGVSVGRWSRPGAPTVPLVAGQEAHLSPKCTEPEWNQADPPTVMGAGVLLQSSWLRAPAAPALGRLCSWKDSTMHAPLFAPASQTLTSPSNNPRNWQAVSDLSGQDSVCTGAGSDGCKRKTNQPEPFREGS